MSQMNRMNQQNAQPQTPLVYDATQDRYVATLPDGRLISVLGEDVREALAENPQPDEALIAENWIAGAGFNPDIVVTRP